jgi:DNA-binding CsgD family transcriptional regulator
MCGPTARQLEIIAAVVATGSQKAAAVSLGITEHTVNANMGKLRVSLGDVTTPQAIYILTVRGLLVVTLAA